MDLKESRLFTEGKKQIKSNIASVILSKIEFFNGTEESEEIKSRTLEITSLFNHDSVRPMMDSIADMLQNVYGRRRLGYKDSLTLILDESFIGNKMVQENLEYLLYELSPSGVKIIIIYPVDNNQFDVVTDISTMVLTIKEECRKQDLIGCSLGYTNHEETKQNINNAIKTIHSSDEKTTEFISHRNTCYLSSSIGLVEVAEDYS